MSRASRAAVRLLVAGAAAGAMFVPLGAQAAQPLTIKVLSNRADLISGGDALVQVSGPARVLVNGKDASGAFKAASDGTQTGLIEGLKHGKNDVIAIAGQRGARLVITNHPNSGPVLSGPQLKPWRCQDTAANAACDEPPTFGFLYRSTNPAKTGLHPYDPANPPADVATTTTDQGVQVPFIVRKESGYLNRDRYTIHTLFQPDQPWTAASPQGQWNRKALIPGGSGCGQARTVGDPPLEDTVGGATHPHTYELALSRGFAVISHALANTGHACNPTLAAEGLMMVKERLIEQYGKVRYTIGTGCSGGSLVQMWVANAYPGIYDGITPACTYTDAFSTLIQFTDYHVLRGYFENPATWGPGVGWTEPQMADVAGHAAYPNLITADTLFGDPIVSPSAGACPGAEAQRYHPKTNPRGVRCGIMDYNVHALGPRPEAVWTDNEKTLGKGFAGSTIDSVGVQYGLDALKAGRITPEMFLDLNEKIGGVDIDFQRQPTRSQGDPNAIAGAYRSGGLNMANNLNQTAIISGTGPDPTVAHDVNHSFWVRHRLDREHGNHDNHVMWQGPVYGVGYTGYYNDSFLAMDRWLAAVEKDKTSRSIAAKVAANRPADVHDKCLDAAGRTIAAGHCPEPLQTNYATPRTVAGMPDTADVLKCQLRPLSRNDEYGPLGMNAAQWARMQKLFPSGVCDYRKPGVREQDTIAWATYGTSSEPIYGGKALGVAPASTSFTVRAAGEAASSSDELSPLTGPVASRGRLPTTGAGSFAPGAALLLIITAALLYRRRDTAATRAGRPVRALPGLSPGVRFEGDSHERAGRGHTVVTE